MDEQQVVLADDELWGEPPPTGPTVGPDGTPEVKPGGRGRRWLVAVLGTAAIGVGAVVGANLASSGTQNLAAAGQGGPSGAGGFGGPGGPGGRGNGGTVASIDGATIKMTTRDGSTVTVVTSASTTVSLSSTGTLGDVKVGDNVRVSGTTTDSTVAGTSITDSGATALADGAAGPGGFGGPPPNGAQPGFGPPTTGVVKAVNGTSFTVSTTAGGTVTVTTSSATTVTVVKPGTASALKVGDTIQVNGTTATDGTITADSIRSGAVAGGR